MKWLSLLSALFALILAFESQAQRKSDEEELRRLPTAYSEAWAKHDGRELAKIMSEDVDYVTVAATWLHGREDFEKYHTRLLSGRFKETIFTPLKIAVRFLRPDFALVHWSWSIPGYKSPDGTPRPQRFGLLTMLAEKRNGTWLVVAAQNTNSSSIVQPDAHDITSPIEVPRSPQG